MHTKMAISLNYLRMFVKGATGRQPFTPEAEKTLLYIIQEQRRQYERLVQRLENRKDATTE